MRSISKHVFLAASVTLGSVVPSSSAAWGDDMSATLPTRPTQTVAATEQAEPLIQIAVLLDTSGSMKGLVDQARAQLWNVVSDLAKASRDKQRVRLEIAVYQYGTDLVSKKDGCLRQIVPFTDDLDDVSAGLFSLAVRGGDEYCGQVIGAALDDLKWDANPNVYKAIFIAGNESFDQGKTTFGQLLPVAVQKSVTVNAVYCGTRYDDRQWRDAANVAGGAFAKIDHNHHLPNIATPFDSRMRELNRKMNETFVWYGAGGERAAKSQAEQDRNAGKLSDHAFASRMSTKIGHLYHHVHDDLVDAVAHGKVELAKMPEELMPESLRKMSGDDRIRFISETTRKRRMIQRQMAETIANRHAFLEMKMQESIGGSSKRPVMLGDALRSMVRKQVQSKGYRFGKSDELARLP